MQEVGLSPNWRKPFTINRLFVKLFFHFLFQYLLLQAEHQCFPTAGSKSYWPWHVPSHHPAAWELPGLDSDPGRPATWKTSPGPPGNWGGPAAPGLRSGTLQPPGPRLWGMWWTTRRSCMAGFVAPHRRRRWGWPPLRGRGLVKEAELIKAGKVREKTETQKRGAARDQHTPAADCILLRWMKSVV